MKIEVKELTEKCNSAKKAIDNVKNDLYSHLTEVFSRIMQYHPYDGFEKFEEISILVKQTNFTKQDAMKDSELNGLIANKLKEMNESQVTKVCETAKALLDEKINASPLEKELLSDAAFSVPNLYKQAEMLKWAGICFGQQ